MANDTQEMALAVRAAAGRLAMHAEEIEREMEARGLGATVWPGSINNIDLSVIALLELDGAKGYTVPEPAAHHLERRHVSLGGVIVRSQAWLAGSFAEVKARAAEEVSP